MESSFFRQFLMSLWDTKGLYDIIKGTLDISGLVLFSSESDIMSADLNDSFLDSFGFSCYLDVSETVVY